MDGRLQLVRDPRLDPEKAIRAAGKRANWVRVRVALRATDDPDCKDGIDHASGTWWHVHDRWGDEYGGADEATAVWFRRTKRRLEADRERAASRALGIWLGRDFEVQFGGGKKNNNWFHVRVLARAAGLSADPV